MKVMILAFDGLEYSLVEKWNLKNLKQTQYGRVAIPPECYTETVDPAGNKVYEPWTPYVWASFMTGKLPSEIGLTKAKAKFWKNPILQFLKVVSMRIKLDKIKGKGKLFQRMGFQKKQFNILWDAKCLTIFHYAKNPSIINVPLVSEEWSLRLEEKTFDEMIKNCWENFWEIKSQTIKAIEEENWDLLMSYVRFLDIVGELCFGNFREMFKAYMACNIYVGQIKKITKDKVVCLIVSDHGMERFGNTKFGKHSDYAFYSLNMKMSQKPHLITDFYAIITDLLVRDIKASS